MTVPCLPTAVPPNAVPATKGLRGAAPTTAQPTAPDAFAALLAGVAAAPLTAIAPAAPVADLPEEASATVEDKVRLPVSLGPVELPPAVPGAAFLVAPPAGEPASPVSATSLGAPPIPVTTLESPQVSRHAKEQPTATPLSQPPTENQAPLVPSSGPDDPVRPAEPEHPLHPGPLATPPHLADPAVPVHAAEPEHPLHPEHSLHPEHPLHPQRLGHLPLSEPVVEVEPSSAGAAVALPEPPVSPTPAAHPWPHAVTTTVPEPAAVPVPPSPVLGATTPTMTATALPTNHTPPTVGEVGPARHVRPALLEAARHLKTEGGRTSLVIRLDPPELGAVLVRLTVRDGQVDVQLRTPDAAARSDLQAQSFDVKQVLREQGLDLSSFDVQHGDAFTPADPQNRETPDRGTPRRGLRADGQPRTAHVMDDVSRPQPAGTWL